MVDLFFIPDAKLRLLLHCSPVYPRLQEHV